MFSKANLFRKASDSIVADIIVVAGGGAGGAMGGGGGSGGVVIVSGLSVFGNNSVIVGIGGANTASVNTSQGTNGTDSIFGGITAIGGGTGGTQGLTGGGFSGGSGGGGGLTNNAAGIANQGNSGGGTGYGNNGGTGDVGLAAAGGGGAGTAGSNALAQIGGNGGNGVTWSINGVTYGGGGGGGGRGDAGGSAGTGGSGGGGNGDNGSGGTSTAGTDGLGGGGGGSGYDGAYGTPKKGGDGVVIVSYVSGVPLATGGTITSAGGRQYHTFTSNGTFSFSENFSNYSIGTSLEFVAPNYILSNNAAEIVDYFNANTGHSDQGKAMYTIRNAAYNGSAFFPNVCSGSQFIEAKISSSLVSGDPSYGGGTLGLCASSFNVNGWIETGYTLDLRHFDGLTIYRMDAGSPYHVLAASNTQPPDYTNYILRLEKVGNTLNAYMNGTLILTASDSTYQSGYIEFGGTYDSEAYYTNVQGGNILGNGQRFRVM